MNFGFKVDSLKNWTDMLTRSSLRRRSHRGQTLVKFLPSLFAALTGLFLGNSTPAQADILEMDPATMPAVAQSLLETKRRETSALSSVSRRQTPQTYPIVCEQTNNSATTPYPVFWGVTPYLAGPGALENGAFLYGAPGQHGEPRRVYPTAALEGSIRIPVIMVNFSDQDPGADPRAGSPYQPATAADLEEYLNSNDGVGAYFRRISGGRLNITFEVHGWLSSADSAYLKPLSAYDYELNNFSFLTDLMHAAVVELGIDFRRYDSDGNNIIDGLAIVPAGYQARPALTGVDAYRAFMSMSGASQLCGDPDLNGWLNVAASVPDEDPHFNTIRTQDILLARYTVISEYYSEDRFTGLDTWAHEFGHVLLGYNDHYYEYYEEHLAVSRELNSRHDLGLYAMSARGVGGGSGLREAAALEKYFYGRWLEPVPIEAPGRYLLDFHEVGDQGYDPSRTYLYRISSPADGLQLYIEAQNKTEGVDTFFGTEAGLVVFGHYDSPDLGSEFVLYPRFSRWVDQVYDTQSPFPEGSFFEHCFSDRCLVIDEIAITDTGMAFTLSNATRRPTVIRKLAGELTKLIKNLNDPIPPLSARVDRLGFLLLGLRYFTDLSGSPRPDKPIRDSLGLAISSGRLMNLLGKMQSKPKPESFLLRHQAQIEKAIKNFRRKTK